MVAIEACFLDVDGVITDFEHLPAQWDRYIGDLLAPNNHSELAAAILKPYVSDEAHWILQHHGVFQAYYYAHHLGGDRNARDRYRGHPHFDATVRFCEDWDQPSFDPAYNSMPLESFEPLVRRIFSREPYGLSDRALADETY